MYNTHLPYSASICAFPFLVIETGLDLSNPCLKITSPSFSISAITPAAVALFVMPATSVGSCCVAFDGKPFRKCDGILFFRYLRVSSSVSSARTNPGDAKPGASPDVPRYTRCRRGAGLKIFSSALPSRYRTRGKPIITHGKEINSLRYPYCSLLHVMLPLDERTDD